MRKPGNGTKWRAACGRILTAAIESCRLPFGQKAKYLASATEQEIEAGAMKVADADKHVFCFFRRIDGLARGCRAGVFVDLDAQGAADREAELPPRRSERPAASRLKANVHEYTGRLARGGDFDGPLGPALCDDAWQNLSEDHPGRDLADGGSRPGGYGTLADHEAFGRERTKFFFGREAYLSDIADYLDGAGEVPAGACSAPRVRASRRCWPRPSSRPERTIPRPAGHLRFIGATPLRATSARCWKGCAGRSPGPMPATKRPSPRSTRS